MKVYIIDEQIDKMGGVERVVNTLANNLKKKYEVEIISEIKTRNEHFFNYDDNIKINYLIKNDHIKFWGHKIERFMEIIKRIAFLNRKIKKILRQVEIDDVFIFGRMTVAMDFIPIMKKKRMNNNIIVRDGTNLFCYSEKMKNKLLKYFTNNVNYLVVSSDESKNIYEKFFNKTSMKIIKIYNPLGIQPRQGYDFEKKTIVSAGRLCEQKGFECLIEAFSLVEKKHQDWNLNIYGNGNKKKKLNKMIKELNLNDKVIIHTANKNMVQVFNNSSIFVSTSRYEGYANVLVEAGACGVPLISFNWLTGVEEIIENNNNGIIVRLSDREGYFYGKNNNQDIKNLALAIERLIEDKSICDKFSKQNKRILETREIKSVIKDWMKMIENKI